MMQKPGAEPGSKPGIFLDTSALFAGLWSAEGGARLLLRLGEAGAVQLMASSQVLSEIESALRRKAPDLLADLAVLLDRVQITVTSPAPDEKLEACLQWVKHRGDGRVLADAWQAAPDFFATLDRQHFLENQALRQNMPFPIGTPGDCIEWLRGQAFR